MIFISGLIKIGLGDDIMTEDYSAQTGDGSLIVNLLIVWTKMV